MIQIQQNLELFVYPETPQRVITAGGEVQTNEDGTRDLDLFLTVQFLEDIPTTFFRGHFREDHGVPLEWLEGPTPNLIQNFWKLH